MIDLKKYINILKKYKKYSIDINAEGVFLAYFFIDKDSDWKDIIETLDFIFDKHGKITRITLKEVEPKGLNQLTQREIKVIKSNIRNYKKLNKALNDILVGIAIKEL